MSDLLIFEKKILVCVAYFKCRKVDCYLEKQTGNAFKFSNWAFSYRLNIGLDLIISCRINFDGGPERESI